MSYTFAGKFPLISSFPPTLPSSAGTAIYLSFGFNPDGGLFSVEIDGELEVDELDSFSAESALCKVGYSKESLENKDHIIVIETVGPSPQAPETSEGGLNVEGIMLVVFRTFSHNVWGVDFLQNNSVTSEEPPPEAPSPSGMPRWAKHYPLLCYDD